MKTNIQKIVLVFLLIFSIFHASITIAYNLPITPLKEKFNRGINIYMNPLFSQTWQLFAPNPANANQAIEVKLTYGNGQETKWISFSDMIHDKSQASFFSYYQFYSAALIQMNNDVLQASQDLLNSLSEERKKTLTEEIRNTSDVIQRSYLEDLIPKEEVKNFLVENPSVNSLLGLIYHHLEKGYFSKITDMQIRISTEHFPEYGKEGESLYYFFYLPKVKLDQLIKEDTMNGKTI
ncbi:DUF5819 family protein [Sporosarcina sp. UB5]|uniref:DUF5819 family protein n=1 Tax=Sporosarcina sp. UB5 TaxID=3047463 RepID=UPI003D79C993